MMQRNLRKVVGTLALTAVAVLGTAACGSSDNSSSSGGTDFCTSARAFDAATAGDSLSNLDEATFTKLSGMLSDLQAKAPAEIKSDLKTFADGVTNVKAILAKYDYDPTKIAAAAASDPDLQNKIQALSDERYTAAGERLNKFLDEKCGIKGGS